MELGLGQENGVAVPNDFAHIVVEPIRSLDGRTIDAGAILGGILLPSTIGDKVENAYRKHLLSVDGSRYTVISDSFARTFSSVDSDNAR